MSGEMSFSVQRVLFVCYGAGHVNMLIPLILKALSDPGFDVTVIGLTTAGVTLQRKGIPYIGFKDLIEEDDLKALEYGKKLASSVPRGGSVPYDETVAYMGLSFSDLVNRYGVEQAETMYKLKGRQAFLPISIMQRAFERFQPNLLVSTNSPRAERAAFMVARERGIPSVCIVGLFARHEVEWLGEPAFGSRICVLSESVKQFIQSAGRHDYEVVVTGNPALDRLASNSLGADAERFRTENNWQGKKIILWASQPEPENHPFTGSKADPRLPRRVDSALLEVASRHPEWQVVIRHHPGENIQPSEWPEQACVSTLSDDLAILLKSSDVVVTMTSTVGLEGILLGKPLITINESVFCDDAPYAKMGLARGVDDLGDLDDLESALMETLVGDWKPQEQLPDVGAAADRIYEVIAEVLP